MRSAILLESDSAALITELRTLGVRTVMITGDAPATAGIVASTVLNSDRSFWKAERKRTISYEFLRRADKLKTTWAIEVPAGE